MEEFDNRHAIGSATTNGQNMPFPFMYSCCERNEKSIYSNEFFPLEQSIDDERKKNN